MDRAHMTSVRSSDIRPLDPSHQQPRLTDSFQSKTIQTPTLSDFFFFSIRPPDP